MSQLPVTLMADGEGAEDDFYLVPTVWLRRWIAGEKETKPSKPQSKSTDSTCDVIDLTPEISSSGSTKAAPYELDLTSPERNKIIVSVNEDDDMDVLPFPLSYNDRSNVYNGRDGHEDHLNSSQNKDVICNRDALLINMDGGVQNGDNQGFLKENCENSRMNPENDKNQILDDDEKFDDVNVQLETNTKTAIFEECMDEYIRPLLCPHSDNDLNSIHPENVYAFKV